jgi:uncharacterized protein
LVKYLITSLVDNPEAVAVEMQDTPEALTFQITLDPADVGKVIGRGGRIIKAIRTLARAAGNTEERQVEVEVVG